MVGAAHGCAGGCFVEISPDWLVRAEAETVLDAVRAIGSVQKAA